MEFLEEFKRIEKELSFESPTSDEGQATEFPEQSIIYGSSRTLSDTKDSEDIASIISEKDPENLLTHWLKLTDDKKRTLVLDHWQLHSGTTRPLSDSDYETLLRIHRFTTHQLDLSEEDEKFRKTYDGLQDKLVGGGVWKFITRVEESMKNLTIANLWHNRMIFGLLDKAQAFAKLTTPLTLILRFSIVYQCLTATYLTQNFTRSCYYFNEGKKFDLSDWDEYTILDSGSSLPIPLPVPTTVELYSSKETTEIRELSYVSWTVERNYPSGLYQFIQEGITGEYSNMDQLLASGTIGEQDEYEPGSTVEPGSSFSSSWSSSSSSSSSWSSSTISPTTSQPSWSITSESSSAPSLDSGEPEPLPTSSSDGRLSPILRAVSTSPEDLVPQSFIQSFPSVSTSMPPFSSSSTPVISSETGYGGAAYQQLFHDDVDQHEEFDDPPLEEPPQEVDPPLEEPNSPEEFPSEELSIVPNTNVIAMAGNSDNAEDDNIPELVSS